jgi:hypothetical protein
MLVDVVNMKICVTFFILLTAAAVFASSAPPSVRLQGKVIDEDGKPVAGLEVTIQATEDSLQVLRTDVAGKFEFSCSGAGKYRLSLNKAGFFRITDQEIDLQPGDNAVSFTVNHETEIHEQVEVYSSSNDIDTLSTTHSERLIAREIRDLPLPSTHDLRSSLRTLPAVVQDSASQLHIAGGRTGETQYLLDGFAIGDPVSGNLTVRVNVDSVQAAEVETGRYSAQFGRSGAGVLSLDTAVGDDRWRAGATNFVPGISARHGLHLTNWYPRLTLSGPLRKGRAWFSEALSVQRTLSMVENLPPHENTTTQWAGDNMLRVQIKLTPNNILHGSFLYNQVMVSNIGLNLLSPISTTRRLQSYRTFFSLKEQVWRGKTLYELGIAGDYSHSDNRPHGFAPYKIMPGGSSGNFFESLWEKTRRWQAIGNITMPTRRLQGTHDLQFGFNIAELGWNHAANRNPIEVVRADRTLLRSTNFSGPPDFNMNNVLAGGYGNDTWRVFKALVLQFGFRADYDRALHRTTPSPRISANFLPFKSDRAKFTAGWGIFLQPVTLSNLGPAYDQQRSDIFYSRDLPVPVLGPVTSRFLLPQEHLQQPRFSTASFGWEQSIGKRTHASINITRRDGRFGLAYEKIASGISENVLLLQNNRRDRYRSFEISFRHSFSDKTGFSASYTRSSTRTNRIFDFSLDSLVFAPQQSGPQGWDTPNRFLSSGWTPLPVWDLFASYFFEYRTGFPFSVVNEQQQLIGQANRMRLPNYASLNIGLEKRIKLFSRKWAVRLTYLNITNHKNADGADNNIDSPNFLHFFGGSKRSLTTRIRMIG